MARDPFQSTGIDNQKKKKINQETKQAMTTEISCCLEKEACLLKSQG